MSYRFAFRGAFAIVAALLLSTTADAQLFRAYLAPAPAGNDANNCTLPSPCRRLLPAALAAVADGGEIWMLDSAELQHVDRDNWQVGVNSRRARRGRERGGRQWTGHQDHC